MSIESAQQASAGATPRHNNTVKATTPAVAAPQQQQQVAMSAVVHMNDVLLNDEMSMMGCDVESWNTARPHFHMQPHTPQQQHATPTFFACPPASLTRHMSLPVAMHHSSNAMAFGAPTTPAHAIAMPPTLVRHHSHGFVMTPQHQHQHYAMARPVVHVAQMQHMFELSLSHQQIQTQQHQQFQQLKTEAFESSLDVEPLPFTSVHDANKLNIDDDDSFDLEPLTYAVFGANERPKNIEQLESAIDSLDRLLPDIEHDLFQQQQQQQQQQQFAAMQQQQQQLTAANLITPRNVVYGRAALPLLLSPHCKEIAGSPALSSFLVASSSNSHCFGPTPKSTKHMATCKVAGCDRRVRSKGFCKTHGGGRKCNIDGCKKSSQNGDFCIGHGGGKKCKEDGCAKAAQSHGLCKAHGGGARCKFLDCNKSSQGGGLCRAHGGGKRCQAAGCPKGAQRGNFCATHGGFRNCKIDTCVRTDRGGGFCEVHRRGRLCKVDGCKKLSRNQGMCTMHIREDKQDESVVDAIATSNNSFAGAISNGAALVEA